MPEQRPPEMIVRFAALSLGLATALAGIWAIHPPSALIVAGAVLIVGALAG